ncbi:hypothetical protein M2333_001571 [Sphingobium sp. B11D3B]|uniref:hypothetical protein n=1 Tax=Sphingobium sp. B11D3B TaxID=2940575 RepID=UPI002225C63A|nr:hypothetical protein [Sphingobium sp. B11D3B]MCW2388525.1 hypothetical protein [Sphingobium sp. B11D3B]
MAWLTLSDARAQELRRFRHRTWMVIALCFFARGADAAFGLHIIEQAPSAAAQSGGNCPAKANRAPDHQHLQFKKGI